MDFERVAGVINMSDISATNADDLGSWRRGGQGRPFVI